MKKLLVLGASHAQIPIIQKAQQMGNYVITCDYLQQNPGHFLAQECHYVSTTDKEAVLALAKDLQVDGIVTYASDAAAPTVAFVAEKLGFQTHPYESVEILSNKELFRAFQKANHLHTPRAKAFESVEQAVKDLATFTLPVMVKPIDSSGSRGVSKITCATELQEKAALALQFSRAGRFVIEEYIEKSGFHIGGDGFSINGELVFYCLTNDHFDCAVSNPFVPIASTIPCAISPALQNKIQQEIQRVLTLLHMQTGAFNFDIRIDANENVFLIELAARNGGDWLPKLIDYATGVDLITYTVKAALGQDCSDLKMKDVKRFVGLYLISSQHDGLFEEVVIQEELKEQLVDMKLSVKQGEKVSTLKGANDQIGLMILSFSTVQEMLSTIDNLPNLVTVKVKRLAVQNPEMKVVHDAENTSNAILLA